MDGGALIGEFGAGFTLASLLALAIGPARPVVFFAAVFGAAVLFLPCLVAVLLASPEHGIVPLAVLLLPALGWGVRRVPGREWRVARALGGGLMLTVRVVVLPRVLPGLLVAAVLGGALLTGKAFLERRPAAGIPMEDPPVGIG